MRFTRLRRMTYHMGCRLSEPGGRRPLLVAAVLLAALCIAVGILSVNVRPLVWELAEAEVTDVVSARVNAAIRSVMSRSGLTYSDLVTMEKDDQGNITALVTNVQQVNTLQVTVSDSVLESLALQKDTIVGIPLGNIFGSTLFAGRGPKIHVKIVSLTSVNTQLHNEFSSAGINQTLHQIMMDVSVSVGFLIPGSSDTADVVTEMCVAETVIVGSVPENYTDIG